mgnify:FL=1|jgi:hypothetical protein
MASSKKVIRKPSQQKTHALRMLLTSGVIRSAEIDPPDMGRTGSLTSSPRSLSSTKSVYTKSVHTPDHTGRKNLLARWHTTFIDILREFSKP